MIHYSFYQKNPASHYIYIDMTVDHVQTGRLRLQLPAWRPGRYELGNFAKNVKRVDVYNEKNEALTYTKLSKDLWEVETGGASEVRITYSYYAAELNAGACYADASQLYVNPVHCCMYVPERMQEEHRLELRVPEHYKIVSSLDRENASLVAKDYDELADSPFIASPAIQTEAYEVEGIRFYLHFNGECRPDFTRMKADFEAFTRKQISFWNDFPYPEYHFLFQILPVRFYHGVEHKKNTVIALGPGYAINSGTTYEDLLGVSCHELFHTWNVKTVRPLEMQPYDYARENYARTGYVYEGFTTYYGDKLLLASGVFTLDQYFKTLEERLFKHFHNFGRYNLSVADSSWETWLDGYVPGAPYRKTNIYDEGSLIALMLDVKIMQATDRQRSLRDVCVLLYERFGKTGQGYTEQTIMDLVNEVSGQDLSGFFRQYVYSPADYEEALRPCLSYLGIDLVRSDSPFTCEHDFGFKVMDNGGYARVILVAPYSPAWKAGLFAGDEILAVNNMMLRNNLNHWLAYFKEDTEISLTVSSGDQLKTFRLEKDKKGTTWFFSPVLKMEQENGAFQAWKHF